MTCMIRRGSSLFLFKCQLLKPQQIKKDQNVCWDAPKIPVYFFAAGSLFKFKKSQQMFGQQMFGPSYFFRLLFSGQFKQKDRNCLLASSSESIVYSWKKLTLKELMSLWDKNCYFCFVFLWLWRTWTNGQISFVSSMVFKRLLIVFLLGTKKCLLPFNYC